MLSYIFSILNFTNPNNYVLRFLVIITLISLLYHFYVKRLDQTSLIQIQESMQNISHYQPEPYVLKQNENVYDEFYVEMYDPLTSVILRTDWEIQDVIIDIMKPDKANSTILDIGAGTGYKVFQMRELGYPHVYGVDKSSAMIERGDKFFPNLDIKLGDVLEPMLYDKNTFSHILCSHFTIYEIENKPLFFKNCYNWLQASGYLSIHLVDPLRFDPVIRVDDNAKSIGDNTNETRNTTTKLELFNCFYEATYDFSQYKTTKQVLYSQKFIDNTTQNNNKTTIRHNEQTLYMDSIKSILQMATNAGFIVHGQVNMGKYNNDEHSYFFILERTM